MTHLQFAQISDIHISALGDHHDLLSGHSAAFLADIIAHLNRQAELDFVLITGDLFDIATAPEVEQFEQVIQTLHKPYYVIPGNHDRRESHQTEGLTRHQFARRFNPQVTARPTAATAQAGYWSVAVAPEVQLIGLDSTRDADWGGAIDETQMAWLEQELAAHAGKLIVLAVHHPLHVLAPIDHLPEWGKFVCDCGPHLLNLLERHPQVKLVLTGHHHISQVSRLGERLHIATPSIAVYPCAYRTFQLSRQETGPWRLSWQTHPVAGPETIAAARRLMSQAWQEFAGFAADFVEAYVILALGNEYDRQGTATL
jgi:3',5'-cyclic AMP phosphodiesterase CpdA